MSGKESHSKNQSHQSGNAGNKLIQAGRDSIQNIQVNVLSNNFPTFISIYNWFKSFWQKDKEIAKLNQIIENLENEKKYLIQEQNIKISNMRSQYELKIKKLKQEKEGFQKEHENLKSRLNSSIEDLYQIFSREGASNENLIILEKIRDLTKDINQSFKELKEYQIASQLVKKNKTDWAIAAKDRALAKHPEIFNSPDLEQKFYQEIEHYLDWLKQSLSSGLPLSLKKFVSTRSVDFPFPYQTAFKYIKQREEIDEYLTSRQRFYLREAIEHLINHI